MLHNNFYKRVGLQFFADDSTPNTIDGIEQRLAAIQSELDKPDADITALSAEVDKLTEQRKLLKDTAEKRTALLNQIAGMTGGTPIPGMMPQNPEQRNREDSVLDSPEYRSAWLKNLQCSHSGLTPNLTQAEQRALSTAASSAGAAVPTQVSSSIVTKVNQYAPLLSEITLLHVPGNVTFAVEKEGDDAKAHTENAKITPDENDGLESVSLSAYEITKLVPISKSVALMTISSFEAWLTDSIARKLAKKLTGVILSGSGSGEGTGLETGAEWTNDSNAVEVGAAASLTTEDVLKLIGLLPGGYDANAKFIMSKKTLFTAFMPLQDKSKNNIVTNEGKDYYIYGYPVLLDERVKLNEAYLGDLSKIVANMPEDMTITSGFDIDTNAYKFLGCCMFDCKLAVKEAFVKLKKADE